MMMEDLIQTKPIQLLLVGNPNSGKSSLFNQLTGRRQKTGNYPGVTVERKTGRFTIDHDREYKVTDLPGTYSIYPTTTDERIATRELLSTSDEAIDSLYIYVADVTKLDKQLLLFSQLYSLNKPMILCLNMADMITNNTQDLEQMFSKKFNLPVVVISSKKGSGIDRLKNAIKNFQLTRTSNNDDIFFQSNGTNLFGKPISDQTDDYSRFVNEIHESMPANGIGKSDAIHTENGNKHEILNAQVHDTLQRYAIIEPFLKKLNPLINPASTKTDVLDRYLTHRTWGPILFFITMILIFQAIFAWAQYPMAWIERGFAALNELVYTYFPSNGFTNLLTEGIFAGIGGIVIFVPQIAILFFLIGILEQTGYMARVVFMMDSTFQKFGMNGRSVVALVSGGACAIPAIMSTRNIAGWKERMITIMVTPLISCSARIPVYALLIAMVVPYKTVGGVFNLQGLTFALMYFLGGFMALAVAFVLKMILKAPSESFLMLELPEYQMPDWKSIFYNMLSKVKTFIVEAGKVIFVISIVLWFLASYGPAGNMEEAAANAEQIAVQQNLSPDEAASLKATYRLEKSYAGIMGHVIEPIIRPIGFDWKIGISLITSFAAREVFVGTMATIYSIGSEDNVKGIQAKMEQATFSDTGKKVYTPATVWSLLLFYAFAMQCMSTLAVVRKETGSWKWPAIQFVYLTLLAYFSSFLIYNILS